MDKNEQDRLNKQMRFIEEIDKEKLIGRQTYLSDASRKENDAEHAWHMAIMAVLLKEYANEKIDVLKTMKENLQPLTGYLDYCLMIRQNI